MTQRQTIWDMLTECVHVLDEPFRASEIVGWFRRHHPEVNESSLRAHIQSATSNVDPKSKAVGLARRTPLITRIDHGVYVRYAVRPATGDSPPPLPLALGRVGTDRILGDVILIGCTATKGPTVTAAKDLFLGARFLKARAYAEASGRPWYVLSAKWGLLALDEAVAPYDVYLPAQSSEYQQAWGDWVVAQLKAAEGALTGKAVEVHAPQPYVDPLRAGLARAGASLIEPLRGLRRGEQLNWYSGPTPPAPAASSATPPVTELVFSDAREIGPFSYRWPDSEDHFDKSWELEVRSPEGSRVIKHGVGWRFAYGKDRRRSVTFVGGEPAVEGVAADDYEQSRCLVSAVKGSDGTIVRRVSDLPDAYSGLPLADHQLEVSARYSRDAVAVKLPEDDVRSWARYALARLAVRSRGANTSDPSHTQGGDARTSAEARPEPTAVASPIAPPTHSIAQVVRGLLDYAATHAGTQPHIAPSFTPDPEANRLVIEDPFAFLLAVIFDQGIPAERAWAAPFRLRERLGHLSPARMANERNRVIAAVGTPPKLHRYVEKMPDWVVAAANIVMDRYGGEAGSIWAGTPNAAEVFRRLDAFPGVGQKKAAMAVEILERDLKVPMRGMHESNIAYDVHVRRVLLRTGIAKDDDLDHMVSAARRAHPERPGAIDFPAWLVGRQWCHAGIPDCAACALREVCPKNIAAASGVRGA